MLFGQAQAFLEQGGLIIIKQIAANAMMLGQLALVLQILSSLLMAPKAIASAALPVLSRLVAGGGGGEIQSVTLILRMSILGAAGIALLGGSIAPWLLIMLLGDQYRVAAEWTGPGLWLLLPLATGALLNQLISAHRRYWNAALSAICGAVVMLGTILALTKVNPLPAVLLGMAAGGFGWTLIGAWQAVRVGGLNLAHAFGRPLIAVALANVMYWLVAQQSELLGLLVACGVLVLGLAPPQSLWTALRRRLGTDG
jgi:O-antigen/teichoic acid export membrane protein